MWARGQPLPDKGLPSTHGRRSRIPRDLKLLPPPVLSHLCSAETLTQHTFPGRSEKARAAAGCLEVAVCWVSCADMFAFGYLDKILCLPPHARPSVGTAFPASWLLLPSVGESALLLVTTDFVENHASCEGAPWAGSQPQPPPPHCRVCAHACMFAVPCRPDSCPRCRGKDLGASLVGPGPWALLLDEATRQRAPWTEEPGRL